VTRIFGILAVGGSSPSADPPGGWETALIVMGTLVVTCFVVVILVERIDLRIELNGWLQKLMESERHRREPPDGRPAPVDDEQSSGY
jgi:hypothetical protein